MKLYIKKYGLWSLWNGLDVWIGKMGLSILSIQLGKWKSQLIWRQSKANVIKNLNSIGFELLDDKENKTVERIKTESLTWYIIKRNN
jgi:hypothetical protein